MSALKPRKSANQTTEGRMSLWLFFIASVLLPIARLLFLYNYNATEVPARSILRLALLLLVGFIALFWLVMLLFRSPFSAFVSCLLGWIFIEKAMVLCALAEKLGMADNGLLFAFGVASIVILALAFALRHVKRPNSFLSVFLAIFVGVFFCINAYSYIGQLVSARRADAAVSSEELYQTSFQVLYHDNNRPNIYWFHLDGMLGLESYEKYYGVSQQGFVDALAKRGFAVNRSARFEALHNTKVALPALVSPHFFDAFLSERLTPENKASFADSLASYNAVIEPARMKKELFGAFAQSGYRTVSITTANDIQYYMPLSETLYSYTNALNSISVGASQMEDYYQSVFCGDEKLREYFDVISLNNFMQSFLYPVYAGVKFFQALPDIYDTSTNLTGEINGMESDILLPAYQDGTSLARNKTLLYAIRDNAAQDRPSITMIYMMDPHAPFLYDGEGAAVEKSRQYAVEVYGGLHQYFCDILISIVDAVLRDDPDAVIVLQADHGLHQCGPAAFEAAFGVKDAQLDMWNNVMSAIRVPAQYQNGDESHILSTPLNMTRYLVNRFVGPNYDYLP